MTSETPWRPFGIGSDKEMVEYYAFHDGIPKWMYLAVSGWVRLEVTVVRKIMPLKEVCNI